MKVAIFGATGRTGRLILKEAIDAGLLVTAYARNAEDITLESPRLTVIEGAVHHADRIGHAVQGADAVLSAVGAGQGTLTFLAHNLIPAMQHRGVERLVSLVGAAVEVPGNPTSLGRSTMTRLMQLLEPNVLDDAREHVRVVASSSLKWTLVRVPRLTDRSARGEVNEGLNLRLGPFHSISRQDLACFMLELAMSPELYIRQSPMVTGLGRRSFRRFFGN